MVLKRKIIVISGPTASGKTAISIKLAKAFSCEVVNFDSLLFYRELNIGTAKPTLEEREGIPHHFVGSHCVSNALNAADYAKLAIALINEKLEAQPYIILVGGSGFYLRALLLGMYPSMTTSDAISKKSNTLYTTEGIAPFIEVLKKHDKQLFEKYHHNDHYRIRRAVEHFWQTGNSFSQSIESFSKQPRNFEKYDWNIQHIHLDIPKKDHLQIIQQRTKQMLKNGLINEVEHLVQMGLAHYKPLQSIGYKETLAYLNNELNSLNELEERINISTRQLAKAQRTWFAKVKKQTYNPIDDQAEIVADFERFIG